MNRSAILLALLGAAATGGTVLVVTMGKIEPLVPLGLTNQPVVGPPIQTGPPSLDGAPEPSRQQEAVAAVGQREPSPSTAVESPSQRTAIRAVMENWKASGPWVSEGDALVHPQTNDLDEALECRTPLAGPCEISLEVQLIGRRTEDARGFWIKSGENEIHVRLDNSPDEFDLKVLPEGDGQKLTFPLDEEHWFELQCRIDRSGTVSAILDGHSMLVSTWKGTFPARLGLECQRSGGRFRKIAVRYF